MWWFNWLQKLNNWAAIFWVQSVQFYDCSDETMSGVSEVECEALKVFYESTNGDAWINNDNWLVPGTSVDSRYGVSVLNWTVSSISMFQNNLSGTIPAEIWALLNLKTLALRSNPWLTGDIPVEVWLLINLTNLNLGFNNLSWSIPSEIWNLLQLSHFSLENNNLIGEIPPELWNLKNVWFLFLWNNNLSWSIPPELGGMESVTWLWLNDNALSGWLPPELSTLDNARTFYLRWNQLSGTIPPEYEMLNNLVHLYLHDNNFSGTIPPELGGMKSLKTLDLMINNFSGTIPPELGKLTTLEALVLDRNNLSGEIPPELGDLLNLRRLSLDRNNLSGNIPESLWYLGNLGKITLNNNRLCGVVPSSFMSLNLVRFPYWLNFDDNYLLDDQASYSAEMWNWLVSKGFVDTNTNRLPLQTPENCQDNGWGDGNQIGDNCWGNLWECEEWYCYGYEPPACEPRITRQKEELWIAVNCELLTSWWQEACEKEHVDGHQHCQWVEPVKWICKESICGDGILDPWEECDWAGQAQCSDGMVCGQPWEKMECQCRIMPVHEPDPDIGVIDTTWFEREDPERTERPMDL
jgi:Leucine-rich repeat (LRR) protein